MSKYSFDQYRNLFNNAVTRYMANDFYAKQAERFGGPAFPEKPGECVVIGIRVEGPEVGYREDTADDTIVMCRVATDGVTPQVKEYAGTTESGRFTQVINPLGDFKLLPGVYYFKRGVHKGKNKCLVQADAVRGQRAKKGQPFSGEFQITDGSLHLHAGILNLNRIGSWSAGCQVIAGGWAGPAWTEFSTDYQRSSQRIFPYVLVGEAEVAGLI